MISGTFNTTLTVLISIDIFVIDNNIKNDRNTCKSKRKDYNLAVEQQKIIRKSIRAAIA